MTNTPSRGQTLEYIPLLNYGLFTPFTLCTSRRPKCDWRKKDRLTGKKCTNHSFTGAYRPKCDWRTNHGVTSLHISQSVNSAYIPNSEWHTNHRVTGVDRQKCDWRTLTKV